MDRKDKKNGDRPLKLEIVSSTTSAPSADNATTSAEHQSIQTHITCPKCHHKQCATDVCEKCGVYFNKVNPKPTQIPQSKKARDYATTDQNGLKKEIAAALPSAMVLAPFSLVGLLHTWYTWITVMVLELAPWRWRKDHRP